MTITPKILIVEDEPALLKALNIEILSQGYEVLSATNGEAALEVIRNETPQLILLDIIMPKMNGFQVLEAMQNDERLKKIPVIMLSNLDQEEDIKKAKDLGARDFYVKASSNLKDILVKIKNVLEAI